MSTKNTGRSSLLGGNQTPRGFGNSSQSSVSPEPLTAQPISTPSTVGGVESSNPSNSGNLNRPGHDGAGPSSSNAGLISEGYSQQSQRNLLSQPLYGEHDLLTLNARELINLLRNEMVPEDQKIFIAARLQKLASETHADAGIIQQNLQTYFHSNMQAMEKTVEKEKKKLLLNAEKEKNKLLDAAKQEASILVKNAQEEAAVIMQTANSETQQERDAASARSQALIARAEQQARVVLEEANQISENLIAEAHQRANVLIAERQQALLAEAQQRALAGVQQSTQTETQGVDRQVATDSLSIVSVETTTNDSGVSVQTQTGDSNGVPPRSIGTDTAFFERGPTIGENFISPPSLDGLNSTNPESMASSSNAGTFSLGNQRLPEGINVSEGPNLAVNGINGPPPDVLVTGVPVENITTGIPINDGSGGNLIPGAPELENGLRSPIRTPRTSTDRGTENNVRTEPQVEALPEPVVQGEPGPPLPQARVVEVLGPEDPGPSPGVPKKPIVGLLPTLKMVVRYDVTDHLYFGIRVDKLLFTFFGPSWIKSFENSSIPPFRFYYKSFWDKKILEIPPVWQFYKQYKQYLAGYGSVTPHFKAKIKVDSEFNLPLNDGLEFTLRLLGQKNAADFVHCVPLLPSWTMKKGPSKTWYLGLPGSGKGSLALYELKKENDRLKMEVQKLKKSVSDTNKKLSELDSKYKECSKKISKELKFLTKKLSKTQKTYLEKLTNIEQKIAQVGTERDYANLLLEQEKAHLNYLKNVQNLLSKKRFETIEGSLGVEKKEEFTKDWLDLLEVSVKGTLPENLTYSSFLKSSVSFYVNEINGKRMFKSFKLQFEELKTLNLQYRSLLKEKSNLTQRIHELELEIETFGKNQNIQRGLKTSEKLAAQTQLKTLESNLGVVTKNLQTLINGLTDQVTLKLKSLREDRVKTLVEWEKIEPFSNSLKLIEWNDILVHKLNMYYKLFFSTASSEISFSDFAKDSNILRICYLLEKNIQLEKQSDLYELSISPLEQETGLCETSPKVLVKTIEKAVATKLEEGKTEALNPKKQMEKLTKVVDQSVQKTKDLTKSVKNIEDLAFVAKSFITPFLTGAVLKSFLLFMATGVGCFLIFTYFKNKFKRDK